MGAGERLAAVLGVNLAFEAMLQRGDRFFHIKRSLYDDVLCGGWHARDKDLAAEWRRFMLEDYPRLIMDNGRENPCHMADAITLAPAVKADAAYWDSPYAALFSSYKGLYDIVDEWPGILLGNSLPPEPPGQPHRRFSSADSAIASFALMMDRSKQIPLWIISYSDSDTMRVTPEEIAVLAEAEKRTTEILRFPFPRARCRKAPGPKSYNECLIVCRSNGVSGTTIAVPASVDVGHAPTVDTQDSADDDGPTCASLFSGIGGTDFALELAGFRCVFACEKDELARKAYEANFGHVPHPDVRMLNPKDMPPFDLLSASWPCQALSVGGRHKGMADERCQLALEIVRIAEGTRPKTILLENANTLPTHDNGLLLKDLLSRFAGIGYHGWWKVIDAASFGLPAQRKRTYVVLFGDDMGVKQFSFPKPTGKCSRMLDVLLPDRQTSHLVIRRPDIFIYATAVARAEQSSHQKMMRVGRVGEDKNAKQGDRIYSAAGIGVTICSSGGGLGANTGLYLINGKTRSLHPREAARALGFSESFLLPESENMALRLIGNSVAIPVVAIIAREIAKTLRLVVGPSRLEEP
jgi:DNA (cytosine-5)-methyltransferase 1